MNAPRILMYSAVACLTLGVGLHDGFASALIAAACGLALAAMLEGIVR